MEILRFLIYLSNLTELIKLIHGIRAQQIKRQYKTHFGRDLEEDIKSETSGNFETVLCALLTPRLDYYVQELYDAMAGVGTDEDALVEILCALSNFEIHAIKAQFELGWLNQLCFKYIYCF